MELNVENGKLKKKGGAGEKSKKVKPGTQHTRRRRKEKK